MTYRLVNAIPAGSQWTGDGTAFIPEGYVTAWGTQAPYGRYSVVAHFITPTGERVMIEQFVTRRITEADVCADLRDAGY